MAAIHLTTLGLHRNPFPPAPDAQCYFYTPQLDVELAEVAHCIEARKGFMLITGEVGLGKSTFVRRLLDIVESKGATVALVFNTFLQDRELLSAINHDFGITAQANMALDMAALNAFLLQQAEEGKPCVLVIDDAQNLSQESLELVRLLCNLETDQEKLLQIVLAGQPELLETLNQNNLRQLKSRIVKHVHLKSLSLLETGRYFDFRLTEAGSAGRLTLDPTACRLLHRVSGGNLRQIHLILDRCLYGLVATRSHVITPKLIKAAIKETRIRANPERRLPALHALRQTAGRRIRLSLAVAGLVGISGAGVAAWANGYLPGWEAKEAKEINKSPQRLADQPAQRSLPPVVSTNASKATVSTPATPAAPSASPTASPSAPQLATALVDTKTAADSVTSAPAENPADSQASPPLQLASLNPAPASPPSPAHAFNDAASCLQKLSAHPAYTSTDVKTARIPQALVEHFSHQPTTCVYYLDADGKDAWLSWLPQLRTVELVSPPPNEAVRQVQLQLAAQGVFDETQAIGWLGPMTRKALAEFQQRNALTASGEPDDLTLLLLETRHDRQHSSTPRD